MPLNDGGFSCFLVVFVVVGDIVEAVVVSVFSVVGTVVCKFVVVDTVFSFLPAWLLLVELLVISLPQTGEWERWVTEAVQKCVHPSAVPSSAGCNVCISDSFQFSLEVEL